MSVKSDEFNADVTMFANPGPELKTSINVKQSGRERAE